MPAKLPLGVPYSLIRSKLKRIYQYSDSPRHKVECIVATEESLNFFELAAQQYADIWISFYLDRCPYSRLQATCVGLKNGHLVARASLGEIGRQPIVWGTQVHAYFSVRDVDVVHCHFVSRLTRLYSAPPDSMLLVFPLPERLDHSQRRFSRRVEIKEDKIADFGLWHGALYGDNAEKLPQFRWEQLQGAFCSVGEISANGMRLDLNEAGPHAARITVNDWILLRGDFGAAAKSSPIFVLGNVVRKMADPQTEGIVCAGCHFMSWRKVSGANSNTWFKAGNEEGIAMIAQWISRNFRSLGV